MEFQESVVQAMAPLQVVFSVFVTGRQAGICIGNYMVLSVIWI